MHIESLATPNIELLPLLAEQPKPDPPPHPKPDPLPPEPEPPVTLPPDIVPEPKLPDKRPARCAGSGRWLFCVPRARGLALGYTLSSARARAVGCFACPGLADSLWATRCRPLRGLGAVGCFVCPELADSPGLGKRDLKRLIEQFNRNFAGKRTPAIRLSLESRCQVIMSSGITT